MEAFRSLDFPSGTYTVTITKAGFGTWSEKDIFLGPTVVRPVNATLTVGQVSTQITVEASAAQVQTETSQVSNAVAQEQVETLPLNGGTTRVCRRSCQA